MKRIATLLLFLCVAIATSMAQRTITGTVTSESGEGLPGATIRVKGTNIGTATNLEGQYRIQVAEGASTLVVSFTGFATKEVEIGTSNTLDITMAESILLTEAVVTGFGVKRDKSNLGYAVSEIESKDLTTARVTNVTNALAAKVPGVRLNGSGGSFTGSSIIIRGYTTFTSSNQPLMVVDGVPIDNSGGNTPLQTGPSLSNRGIDLNQEDIESISVLKGAAATALYGSRAAGGVLLITTKKGAIGQKNSVTYTANYAIQEVNRFPDYQNEYAQGSNGAFNPTAISSWGPRIAGQKVILAPAWRGGLVSPNDSVNLTAYPDNVRDLFRKGYNTQHNLAFQGAKDQFVYRLSLGYLDDQGVFDSDRLNRYNIAVNASAPITDKLSAGLSFNYVYNKSSRTPRGNQLSNPLFRGWFLPRNVDVANLPFEGADGEFLYFDAIDNPLWSIKNNLYDDRISRIFGNFNLRYQLLNWLSAEWRIGLDNYATEISAYDQIGAVGGGMTDAQGAGGIYEARNNSRLLNSYFTLNGTREWGDNFNFNFVLGQETVNNFESASDVIGTGVTVRNFRNLNSNTTTYFPFYQTVQSRIIGVFGNLTTIYRNFATLDLSVRNDWNSTLLEGNNSYLYYSIAGTVNLTEALPSIKSNWLSLFKIRANYGRVGRASLVYATDTYYLQANPGDGFGPEIRFPFNGLSAFTLSNTAGNPNLEPEFTSTAEVGVDISALNDRIGLELTIYQQKTTGVILAVPISPASGSEETVLNAGSLKTDGIEVALNITPIKTRHGAWTTTFNFTKFESIVEDLAPNVDNIFLGGFVTPNIRLVKGDQYGQIYGNAYKRDANGNLLLNANGLPQPTANVQKIGNPNPDWTLGVNNNISYKGFSLNFLLDIRKGGQIYSRNIADLQRQGAAAETAEFDRFNSDGTVSKPYLFEGIIESTGLENTDKFVTAQQYYGNGGKYVAAEGFIYDISWFRVREAAFSYSFPKSILNKTPFGALEVGVFGRNLFLRAPNYPHLDPEQNALGINNAQGLEFNALPQFRSYGVNLRVTL